MTGIEFTRWLTPLIATRLPFYQRKNNSLPMTFVVTDQFKVFVTRATDPYPFTPW